MKKLTLIIRLYLLGIIYRLFREKVNIYRGKMKLPVELTNFANPGSGRGIYQYYTNSDGSRVKHGCFSYKNIKGVFIHGKKSGTWYFGHYTLHFKDNEISGLHKGYIKSFSGVAIISYRANLENGHYVGDIKLINRGNSLGASYRNSIFTGSYNAQGWADGKWRCEIKRGIAKHLEYEFCDGIILRCIEFDASTGSRTTLFELPKEQIEAAQNIAVNKKTTIEIKGIKYTRKVAKWIQFDHSSDVSILQREEMAAKIFNRIVIKGMRENIPATNGFAYLEVE